MLRQDADYIIHQTIRQNLPDEAVKKALQEKDFGTGRLYVAAVGKAAWQMAYAAWEVLGERIHCGVVVTKYDHVKGEIPKMRCYEAGHPVPDENSFIGTQAVLDMVSEAKAEDTVLFLLSGGGSALFEKPLVSGEELADITRQLLASGADIVEMNTIRKRLSLVKGGRFAKKCEPAHVYSIVLSDVLGDPLDMIASGPAYPDCSSSEDAMRIIEKYGLKCSEKALACMQQETPKHLSNVETVITGSVRSLCIATANSCEQLGYRTTILTDQLDCEAKEAGAFLASIAKSHQDSRESLAFIAGGETVVHLHGSGKGGRNQELVLAAAEKMDGLKETAIFSVGSDGTDGPTDAAGGYADGQTAELLREKKVDLAAELANNNAYYALQQCDGLVITGPTGTNVNDVAVVLIKR